RFRKRPEAQSMGRYQGLRKIMGALAGRADRRPEPGLALEGFSTDQLSHADRPAAGQWELGRFAHDRVCPSGLYEASGARRVHSQSDSAVRREDISTPPGLGCDA